MRTGWFYKTEMNFFLRALLKKKKKLIWPRRISSHLGTIKSKQYAKMSI